MTMPIDKIKESAKSLLTLLGGIVSSVLAFGIDEPLAKYLAIAGVIITAILVWLTPNQDPPEKQRLLAAGAEALDKQITDSLTYEDLGGKPFDPADSEATTPRKEPWYDEDAFKPVPDASTGLVEKTETNAYEGKDSVSGNGNIEPMDDPYRT